MNQYFATSPKGMSELLRDELISFGAEGIKVQPSGATFEGDLEVGYRTCLWSRLANRIYLTVLDAEFETQDEMIEAMRALSWIEHMDATNSFSISFSGQGLDITHTHYGALKIKDSIVDYFRDEGFERPSVDTENPDIRIHGHVNRNRLTLGIDLSGHSLHQRGYREGLQVTAPLKENVAAALLIRAGWANIAKEGGEFYDPMCGSGTFLIEAAMIASDAAPGLLKADEKGLVSWKQHDSTLWEKLIEEAEQREAEGLKVLPNIYGSDISHRSLDIANDVIESAGYDECIEIKQMSVAQGRRWGDWKPGLIMTNPPYGERLGDIDEVKQTYIELGEFFKMEFVDWQAAVLTCNTELGMYLGLKARRSHDFLNGAYECKLFRFDVTEKWFRQPALSVKQDLAVHVQQLHPEYKTFDGALMVANRIKKNMKSMKSWVKQQSINAYRVYDADLPEYALAIDLYQTVEGPDWLMVSEYAAPKTVNPTKARRRLYEVMAILPDVFDIPVDRIIYKVRKQQKGNDQYERLEEQKTFFTIEEGPAKLRVNFTDYLDTGLFLDHRDVRKHMAKMAKDKRFLNLFCYTAAATVQAALAGATDSLSVDMSKTYLYWAKHNYLTNNIDENKHAFLQTDVIEWLKEESENPTELFDVIFLDPPSFSSSKKMDGTLDILRDHAELIQQALALLVPEGKLMFSTNMRKFKLDIEPFSGDWHINNISQKTMPMDFKRNVKIHQAWVFTRKAPQGE